MINDKGKSHNQIKAETLFCVYWLNSVNTGLRLQTQILIKYEFHSSYIIFINKWQISWRTLSEITRSLTSSITCVWNGLKAQEMADVIIKDLRAHVLCQSNLTRRQQPNWQRLILSPKKGSKVIFTIQNLNPLLWCYLWGITQLHLPAYGWWWSAVRRGVVTVVYCNWPSKHHLARTECFP